jgi:Ca2+-transporting ATPase
MHRYQKIPFHTLDHPELFQLLAVDPRAGLDAAEVQKRRAIFGANILTARKRRGELIRFLLQFHSPLVYILLTATMVTLFLGEWVDASVIFGVVVVNAIIGYIQEAKAERSIESLAKSVVTAATVRRGGGKRQIPSTELVPGDIVLLQSGDMVPADLRLFHVKSLQADESMLTGESVAVEKHSDRLKHETILAERKNMAFAGTLVTYGQAEGVVWATADQTEMGRIARLLHEAVELSTPLTKKISAFSNILLVIILALAAATFAVGLLRGERAVDMFLAAVALAVGAIPEGLPAAVTITLAVGVTRMARRRAIIRRLPAVETLGSTTVICSDKTGTLTENQMTVRRILAGGEAFDVTGSGYEPRGEIQRAAAAVTLESNEALRQCLLAGLLCNDSQLVRERDRHLAQGDPTEVALIAAAAKAGLTGADEDRRHPRLDVIPFESQHQYMATLHRHADGRGRVIYKKGAAERLVERCATMLDAAGCEQPLDRESIRKASDAMAAQGLRVLAFARRKAPDEQHHIDHSHVAQGLTFLGLQGMIDPPRAEAITAVQRCRQAGITVKMITGDHLLTARAVARQLGLGTPLPTHADSAAGAAAGELLAVSGHELKGANDEALADLAVKASVFARVSPEEKLRLVRALQSRGHVVAMTGDGVNDAPALKQADIGVAMGITGTDAAKGAADMILLDDNFASIEAAVEEGRGVFDNLTKFIVWTLPTNVGEAAILLTAIATGTTLPALPAQLLWVNMMTSIFLGTALVFEPKEIDLMNRPPRDPRIPLITFPLFMRTGLVTLVILIGAFGLFLAEQRWFGATLPQARTIVINVLVVAEAFYLLNCRSLTHSMFAVGFFSNLFVHGGIALAIAAQLAFTYLPAMNALFHTAPISAASWLRIVLVGLTAGLIVGFEKWVRFGGTAMPHPPKAE